MSDRKMFLARYALERFNGNPKPSEELKERADDLYDQLEEASFEIEKKEDEKGTALNLLIRLNGAVNDMSIKGSRAELAALLNLQKEVQRFIEANDC